jgi:NADH dehydrogenase subunit 5
MQQIKKNEGEIMKILFIIFMLWEIFKWIQIRKINFKNVIIFTDTVISIGVVIYLAGVLYIWTLFNQSNAGGKIILDRNYFVQASVMILLIIFYILKIVYTYKNEIIGKKFLMISTILEGIFLIFVIFF